MGVLTGERQAYLYAEILTIRRLQTSLFIRVVYTLQSSLKYTSLGLLFFHLSFYLFFCVLRLFSTFMLISSIEGGKKNSIQSRTEGRISLWWCLSPPFFLFTAPFQWNSSLPHPLASFFFMAENVSYSLVAFTGTDLQRRHVWSGGGCLLLPSLCV